MEEASSRLSYNSHLLGYREVRHQQGYSRSRRRSSNLSDIYKNHEIFAALRQSSNTVQWSMAKKCLFLIPAFAFQFCAVLTAVFSNVNMRVLKVPASCTSVHLILASILSIWLIIAFQKCVQKRFSERKRLAVLLIGFTAYLSVGAFFVLAANLEMMSKADDISLNVTGNATTFIPEQVLSTVNLPQEQVVPADRRIKDLSASISIKESDVYISSIDPNTNWTTISNSSSQNFTTSSVVSLTTQILAFVGYTILASSLTCSHYLLSSIAMSLTYTHDHNSINVIETVAGTFGGGAVSFLGVIDMSLNQHPSNESSRLLIGQIFILLCIAITLLIGCTACSVITCYSDSIFEKFRVPRNNEDNILIGYDRRPTRTAQEIFDECATLLGHRASLSYAEETLSPRNLPAESDEGISNSMSQSEIVADESVHSQPPELSVPYSFQVPTPATETRRSRSCLVLLKSQKIPQTLLLVFLLSSSIVSVEYNSSAYLGCDVSVGEDRSGRSYRSSTRVASAGIFMIYLIFITVYFFSENIAQRTGTRPLALGTSLVAAVLTLVSAISGEVAVYFVVACCLGLLRFVVVRLPGLLSATSQTLAGRRNTFQAPTTAIWCMTPLSLGVASALVTPLTDVGGFHGAAMYYSAACAALGCATLMCIILRMCCPV